MQHDNLLPSPSSLSQRSELLAQELQIIVDFVRRVRSHLVRRRLLEVATWIGASALLWLLVVVVFGAFLPAHWLTTAALWASLVGLSGVLFWRFVGRALQRTRRDRILAREIELAEPYFRNDLVTALQFGSGDGTAHGASPALVSAHLRRTARKTEKFRNSVHALFRTRNLESPMRIAGATAALVVLLLAIFPTLLQNTATLLLGQEVVAAIAASQEEEAEQVRRELLVGDLDITLRFPGYTQARERRLRNSSGHVEVLAGTEVHFEGRLRRDAVSASVVLKNEAGTETELAAEIRGDRIVGNYAALESGTWRFRLELDDQTTLDNDVEREISVLPDTAPTVAIEQPTGMIDVTARESVTFRIAAQDDYGLTEVALVYSLETLTDDPSRLHVARVERQSTWAGEATLDLASLDLKPRDVLVVKAEALDNDEVARPKAGRSQEVRLRVASPEDRHEAILQLEEELVDVFIELLADYLEKPILADEPGQPADDGTPDTPITEDLHAIRVTAQTLDDHRRQVLQQMREVVSQMENDPLMLRRDFELMRSVHGKLSDMDRNARRALDRLASMDRASRLSVSAVVRYGTSHRMPNVAETERTIILLEELIAAQWIDAAQMTVDAIHETIASLKEKVEAYKATQDPELKKEIRQEIARMQRQLQELMARLKQQMSNVPPEHFNADAMGGGEEKEGADMASMVEDAASLQEMLESGDLDGMLEKLNELDGQLESMLGMSDSATRGGGGNGLSPMEQAASELMDAVNDLAQAEGALKSETSQLQSEIRERTTETLEEQLEPFMESLNARLDRVRENLDDLSKMPLNDRDRAALSEVQRAMNSAQPLMDLQDIEGLRPVLDRMADNADKASRRLRVSQLDLPRNDPQRRDYQGAMDEADEVEEIARSMVRDIDNLLRSAQIEPSDEDVQKMDALAEQQQRIREQSDQLAQKLQEAGAEFPSLVEELEPQLGQAQEFMEGASEKLSDRRLLPGMEDEQQALRTLHAMKRQLQQTIEKNRMGESQGQDEPVAIPDPDRRAPKAFREDIMDAMKEQGLNDYEDENSLYYKSLIE